MRTTLTLLLSRLRPRPAARRPRGRALPSRYREGSRGLHQPPRRASRVARPSTSASISIRTKRESGELIVCPSHRRSERRMKARLAPVHPNVRCHQPRRGPSPEASASSLSAVGTGASAGRSFCCRLVLCLLGAGLPRRLCRLRLFGRLGWRRLCWYGLGRGDDLGRFVRLLRSRPAGLGLRLRRSFDFRDRLALPRSGARPWASCPVRQSLPARHLQRQRRRACPRRRRRLRSPVGAASSSRRPLGSHLGGVLRRPLAGLRIGFGPVLWVSPPSRRPRPRPPRRLRRRRRPGRSSCA